MCAGLSLENYKVTSVQYKLASSQWNDKYCSGVVPTSFEELVNLSGKLG